MGIIYYLSNHLEGSNKSLTCPTHPPALMDSLGPTGALLSCFQKVPLMKPLSTDPPKGPLCHFHRSLGECPGSKAGTLLWASQKPRNHGLDISPSSHSLPPASPKLRSHWTHKGRTLPAEKGREREPGSFKWTPLSTIITQVSQHFTSYISVK